MLARLRRFGHRHHQKFMLARKLKKKQANWHPTEAALGECSREETTGPAASQLCYYRPIVVWNEDALNRTIRRPGPHGTFSSEPAGPSDEKGHALVLKVGLHFSSVLRDSNIFTSPATGSSKALIVFLVRSFLIQPWRVARDL